MAEEVGIVMSLYDRVSPTLKAIAGNTKAFDKNLDELEQSLKNYDKAQDTMTKRSSELKKELEKVNQSVIDARKAYKTLKDETSKGALDAAIDEQTRLRRELDETERAIKANSRAYENLYDKARRMADGVQRATESQFVSGNGGGMSGMMAALGQAGAWSMLGDVASQWAGTLVTSAGGSDAGTFFSSALSGAGSGAAIGSLIAPGVGTALGALIGGVVGLAGGASQVYQSEDEAFKDYYQQLYEQGQTAAEESLTSGSATASQRELDAIAFNRLLGSGVGDTYLSDLRTMAADTPMEYEDLTTMSRALATGFGESPERMLDLMTAIGDAGSAVGGTADDMSYMAQSMSRMQSSGKATLEYLNIFQERGVDVIGMLSEAMGKTQGEIYDMISKGQISGQTAVDIIQAGMEEQYGGAMETMAQTFSGLTSTLEDAMTEIDAARGQGYNETRKGGLQDQVDAYGGELGAALTQLNRIAGQNEAYMENLSEQYTREALEAVLLGKDTTLYAPEQQEQLAKMAEEYNQAKLQADRYGDQEARLTMEDLYQEAQSLATIAYESSDAYLKVHESELDLIESIRTLTASFDGWSAKYAIQQELSKGRAESWLGVDVTSSGTRRAQSNYHRYASGLGRVPYNNYPAFLDEGERVLTAAEARTYGRGSGGVMISGNTFVVRQESDIDAIAASLLAKLKTAGMAGAYG